MSVEAGGKKEFLCSKRKEKKDSHYRQHEFPTSTNEKKWKRTRRTRSRGKAVALGCSTNHTYVSARVRLFGSALQLLPVPTYSMIPTARFPVFSTVGWCVLWETTTYWMGNKQLVVFLRWNHRRCTKIRVSPSGIYSSLSEGSLGFCGEQSIILMYLQPTKSRKETATTCDAYSVDSQTLIRLELGHWITFRPFHRYSTYLSSFASSNRWKVVPIIYIRTNFPETAIWRDLIKLDTIDTHKRAVQPFINTRIKKNLERNTTADSFIKRKSYSWYRHP